MNEKNRHEKCLSCKHIRFANFLLKEDELEGGEFYVLNECIKQKKVFPCQPMSVIDSCYKLYIAAWDTLNIENEIEEGKFVELPLFTMVWQCFYDLKASAFLALTAHHRSANQLLRPIVENLLVGLYFETKLRRASTSEDSKELKQVLLDLDRWREDRYTISEEEWVKIMGRQQEERKRRLGFGFLIEWLKREKVLTKIGQGILVNKAQSVLNKYIHPYFQYMDIGKENYSKSPETTRYDGDLYYEWLEIFQNIMYFVIGAILSYYPSVEETEGGKEALGYLKSLEKSERELGIVMIKSKYLKDFIAHLPDIN
jgi:hypothetical protein